MSPRLATNPYGPRRATAPPRNLRAAAGRADLVTLIAALPPKQVAGAAALLGFREPDKLNEQKLSPSALATADDIFGDLTPAKPELFWRLEEISFRDEPTQLVQQKPAALPLTQDDLTSPGRSLFKTPPTAPLAPWSRLWPTLRTMLQSSISGREPDLPALLRDWTRGEVLGRIPRSKRRVWAARASVWVDRSPRLAPFWTDQADVCRRLHAVCGHSGFTVHLLDAQTQHWTMSQQGHLLPGYLPDPETPILVLGDLGIYGSPAERAVWLATAHRLKGTRISALLPAPPSRWDPTVTHLWAAVPWERGRTAATARHPEAHWQQRADRLLRLAAPAAFVQPGLLRALRRLLPASETDAATEVDVFHHSAVRAADSLGLVLHAAKAVQLRQDFADHESPELKRRVSAALQHWHQGLPKELLRVETLAWLALIPTEVALPPGDRDDALDFAERLEASVTNKTDDDLSATVRRYARTMLLALPDSVYQTVPALKRVCAAAFAGVSGVRVPIEAVEFHEEPVRPLVLRVWDVCQLGNRLIFLPAEREYDPDTDTAPSIRIAPMKSTGPYLFVRRGAEELATQYVLKEGLSIPLVADQRLELRTDAFTAVIAGWRLEPWAVAAGHDSNDLWADALVKGVKLRFRWIPTGCYPSALGPLEDEEGEPLYEEIPRRSTQPGFWMTDAPCSQALWLAVMGGVISQFKSDRPTEVDMDACQIFLRRLNVLAPYLEARLPPDVEWEHTIQVKPNMLPMRNGTMFGEPGFRLARDANIPVSPIYRISDGLYQAVPGSGVIVSDTCGRGIMGAELETARLVRNDGAGNVSVCSSDNRVIIGTGPVRYNKGILTSGPVRIFDDECVFTANYEVFFTVTADNAFEMTVTQWRTNSMSKPGYTCKQPESCKVTYRIAHRLAQQIDLHGQPVAV